MVTSDQTKYYIQVCVYVQLYWNHEQNAQKHCWLFMTSVFMKKMTKFMSAWPFHKSLLLFVSWICFFFDCSSRSLVSSVVFASSVGSALSHSFVSLFLQFIPLFLFFFVYLVFLCFCTVFRGALLEFPLHNALLLVQAHCHCTNRRLYETKNKGGIVDTR